jgi:hypothetical protein
MVEWARIVAIVIPVLSGAALAGTVGELALRLLRTVFEEREGQAIGERMDRLTHSLKEAIDLIDQIEGEIRDRHALATRLQEDVRRYERLAALKGEEVEAVAQLFRAELHLETRRSFWRSAALNSVFFLLGVAVTVAVAVAL